MGKPDDIPQDVWDAASVAWQCADNREDRGIGSIEEIARAILAERERSVKIAGTPHEDDDRMDRQIRSDIAAAIREGRHV